MYIYIFFFSVIVIDNEPFCFNSTFSIRPEVISSYNVELLFWNLSKLMP